MTAIVEQIQKLLDQIESDNDVRILYACESGSRAWGFESTDSDYDVRFIYARPADWYLSIDVERKRDVIELPVDEVMDISGWDLRKALQLFYKSNPPLYEWLRSPIVYRENGPCADRMRELAPVIYNPISAHHHYLSMAGNNVRNYLSREQIPRKKYLYALRPILAVRWIEQGRGVVPTEFQKLVESSGLDDELLAEIDELLRQKRATGEMGAGPKLPRIHHFIESEKERFETNPPASAGQRPSMDQLNQLFRELIG